MTPFTPNDPPVHRPQLTRKQMIDQILDCMNAVEDEKPQVLAGLILDYCADQFGAVHPVDPPADDPPVHPPVHRPPSANTDSDDADPPVHRPD